MSQAAKPEPLPLGLIVDPFGHGWTIGSHVEDLAPDELMRRMSELAEAG